MNDSIIVIDNFIPKILQNQLENISLGHENIDYYFRRDPSYLPDNVHASELRNNDDSIVDKKEWVLLHELYSDKFTSKFHKDFVCIFNLIQKNLYNNATLLRARLVLSPPLAHTEHMYGPPHFDNNNNNIKAAVYYVSDSDGDTILFEEKYVPGYGDHSKKTILQKVSPKKGRIVIFDANRFHSNSWPTKKERVIVNWNFSV
jgi:hypothetical protein